MAPFEVISDFVPSGDQPDAIAELEQRITAGEPDVVLLGATGTGKTFTIAALYVRLVLGHGDTGLPALLPSQVLVMTFTKAATRELSHRIRSRLVEAAACFRGAQPPQHYDTFLQSLLAAYPDPAKREEAAWRLASAADESTNSLRVSMP